MKTRLSRMAAELASAVPWSSDPVVAIGDAHGVPILVSDAARSPSLEASGVYVSRFFAEELGPGDAVISNDPFVGASHVTDFTLVRRARHATAMVRMRLPDIGGFELGGLAPQSFDTWGEGARFPALRIAVAGAPRAEALDLIALNTRTPRLVRRGLAAMEAVADRVAEALDSGTAPDHTPRRAAAAEASSALATLADGAHCSETLLESRFSAPAPRVRVELTVGDGRLRLSLAGSSAQLEAPLNSPAPHTLDCCLSALAEAVPGFPLAPGALDALELDPGAGTITGARVPAITGLAPFLTARAIRCAVTAAAQAAGALGGDPDAWWAKSGRRAYEAHVDPVTLRLPESQASALVELEKASG